MSSEIFEVEQCFSFSTNPQNLEILWLKCTFVDWVYFVACCYHAPKPDYDKSVCKLNALSSNIDSFLELDNALNFVIARDLNQLDTSFLEITYGFTQFVCNATHGANILDKCFVSRPDILYAKVFKSILKV